MISVFPLAVSVQLVKAAGGTIYIRADGSVDPPSAPISNIGNAYYTFTANIYDSIVVERDNVVVNGAGHVLEGPGGYGITLTGRSNVTIKSITIKNFYAGINLTSSLGCKLYGNKIANTTWYGIYLYRSNNTSVFANTITNSEYEGYGIHLSSSSNNSMSANTITNNDYGIYLINSSNSNSISANSIVYNNYGIYLYGSATNNSVSANNVISNRIGIYCHDNRPSNNIICHNNFVDNTRQVDAGTAANTNTWDDGYSSGGNYWSNYTGVDHYKGAGQNVLGTDEIGDTPYVIAANNTDHYPLLNPYTATAITNVAGLVVRGSDNRIYYRTYSATTDSWTGWNALPGTTIDSPATALCNNELHVVVRSSSGNKLYHGYVNLMNGVFSGWALMSGSTPSAPTLTSNGTVLSLVVRGSDNRTYYRTYSFNPRSWGSWNALTGSTGDSPAAALLGNNLHIVVRGSDGSSLWDIVVKPGGGVVRNWRGLSGSTPSKPVLTADQAANKLYLTVRGGDSRIYWRSYDGAADSWASYSTVPTGTTGDAPAATVMDNKLHIVIRSMTGTTLYHGNVDLATSELSSWTPISGSTPSTPTLTS